MGVGFVNVVADVFDELDIDLDDIEDGIGPGIGIGSSPFIAPGTSRV